MHSFKSKIPSYANTGRNYFNQIYVMAHTCVHIYININIRQNRKNYLIMNLHTPIKQICMQYYAWKIKTEVDKGKREIERRSRWIWNTTERLKKHRWIHKKVNINDKHENDYDDHVYRPMYLLSFDLSNLFHMVLLKCSNFSVCVCVYVCLTFA